MEISNLRGNAKSSQNPKSNPQKLIMIEICDEEGLEKVVERYMQRNEIKTLALTKEDVAKAIVEHAKESLNPAGKRAVCINCIYSAPARGRLSWLTRTCVLGFIEDNCEMFKPIVREKK